MKQLTHPPIARPSFRSVSTLRPPSSLLTGDPRHRAAAPSRRRKSGLIPVVLSLFLFPLLVGLTGCEDREAKVANAPILERQRKQVREINERTRKRLEEIAEPELPKEPEDPNDDER